MSSERLLHSYFEHQRELLLFLSRRTRSRSLAADLTHSLYFKLLGAEPRAAVRDRRAYLFRMAANLANDHVRVERRRDEIRAEVGALLTPTLDELTPERHLMAKAEIEYLAKAVATLDSRCRTIFYMSRFEGLSQEAIAEKLSLGQTTVYKELKTAMRTLTDARRRFRGRAS